MTDSESHGSEDPQTDEQYHLEVTTDDVADSVLLPGNPERVEKVTDSWDDHEVVANHREYRTATGTHDGTPISVTSTGIGSPSSAIAVEELARVGADTLIRVGSCGAIQPETDIGDLVITSGAVRQEGTSKEYIREDYPAVADHAVVAALAAAADELGYDYHVGLTASTDSFYAGQSREGYEGFLARDAEEKIEELRQAGVLNFEMEASAILTLASIYGLRAGAVCTVYADRTTGEFEVTGERRAAKTASKAVSMLAEMDSLGDVVRRGLE
jgi:uridine phosphorylase